MRRYTLDRNLKTIALLRGTFSARPPWRRQHVESERLVALSGARWSRDELALPRLGNSGNREFDILDKVFR